MCVITGTIPNIEKGSLSALKMTYMTIRFYKNTKKCNAAISEKISSIRSKYITSKMKYLWPKR